MMLLLLLLVWVNILVVAVVYKSYLTIFHTIDAVSSHRLVPFNNEDEVFAVDDDEFVNGELNDNEVINAEDLEFGNDGVIENDVANHDQGWFTHSNFIVSNCKILTE